LHGVLVFGRHPADALRLRRLDGRDLGRADDGRNGKTGEAGSESGTSCGQARFSAAVIITTQIRPVACSCAGWETTRAGRRCRTGLSV